MADDKTVAALAAAIKSLQNSIDSLGNSKGESGDTLFDRADNLAIIEEERIARLEKERDIAKEQIALDEKSAKTVEDYNKIVAKRNQLLSIEEDLIKSGTGAAKDKAKILGELRKATEESNESSQDMVDILNRGAQATKNWQDNVKGFLGVQKGFVQGWKERGIIKRAMGGPLSDEDKKEWERQREMDKKMTAGRLTDLLGASVATKALEGGLFSLSAMFIKSTMTAQELATAYTAMTGRIARADKGIQLELFREIAEVGPKVVETLVAIENAIPIQKLQELGIRGTLGIARNIALWEKFGVAVDTSAEIFVDLLRVFNTAPQEVIPAMEEVMKFATVINKSPAMMMEEFQRTIPRLAIYSGDVTKIFMKISEASAALNVPTENLIGLNESLQTLGGSADLAGKINAIIGRAVVDPMTMLQNSFEPDGVIRNAELIRDAFARTGQDVYQMGAARIRMISSALNMDPDVVKKFLSGKMDICGLEKEMADRDLNALEVATKTNTLMDIVSNQLAKIGSQLPILIEALESFRDFVANPSISPEFKAALKFLGIDIGGSASNKLDFKQPAANPNILQPSQLSQRQQVQTDNSTAIKQLGSSMNRLAKALEKTEVTLANKKVAKDAVVDLLTKAINN